MADDVLAAADVLGRSSLRGVGHSMGGAALLQAELARPGLLRSAYLYEPTISLRGFPREAAARLMAAAARRRRSMFPSRFDALVQYANRPPLNVLRGDALLAYVEHGFGELPGGSVHLKCAPEAEASTFESEPKMTIDLAEGVAVPTTVAVGQRVSEPDVAQF